MKTYVDGDVIVVDGVTFTYGYHGRSVMRGRFWRPDSPLGASIFHYRYTNNEWYDGRTSFGDLSKAMEYVIKRKRKEYENAKKFVELYESAMKV